MYGKSPPHLREGFTRSNARGGVFAAQLLFEWLDQLGTGRGKDETHALTVAQLRVKECQWCRRFVRIIDGSARLRLGVGIGDEWPHRIGRRSGLVLGEQLGQRSVG